MKIHLVRHGETDANREHILQGQTQNLQLNNNGVKQAIDLKNKLKDVEFNVCYTSPLIRTWSTAMILVGDRTEIKEDKRLIERYFGDLECQPVKLYDSKKYWDFNLNSHDNNIEPIKDVFDRCISFIEDIKNNHNNDDTILIVSHGAIVRCLYHLLKNTDLNKNLLDFKIENCYHSVCCLKKKEED